MKKIFFGLGVLVVLLILIYFLGPRPEFEEVNPDPQFSELAIDEIEDYIKQNDAKVSDLKPGNEGFIQWNDPGNRKKTEYVVLYLHGFSASGEEGSEFHRSYAAAIGANLYVPRLFDNGRASKDTYKDLTPKKMLDSAKEAIAVARLLGEKIILVSCSTGSTYSAYLGGYDKDIYAQILLSPNIDIYDTNSELMLKPWGKELLRIIEGGDYHHITHYTDEQKKYWNATYHIDGLIALKDLIHQTMKEEHFEKIEHPSLVIAYYKNEEEQDKVVSVKRMKDFYNEISTPALEKRFIECPECQAHVIGNKLFNSNTELVLEHALQFTKEVLKIGLKPKEIVHQ